MTTHREVTAALYSAAAEGDPVVLATVVRVTGSSYGGVGARMVIRADGSTVGLVSGGCLESDLAEHARRVHASGQAEVVTYDTRDDDDAPWGLGLGCNGLIEVLLEPLPPQRARDVAALIDQALTGETSAVIATVLRVGGSATGSPSVGSHALLGRREIQSIGEWGTGSTLADAGQHVAEALTAGRRGVVREIGAVEVAFEVVVPAVRLVICGTGPDAAPVARFASQLGWDVTVVEHRRITDAHSMRFPGVRVVECVEALQLADVVPLSARSTVVVMSHSFGRDRDYVEALLEARVAYVGVLGPRARTERMLTELAARDVTPSIEDRFFAPVGLDLGGEGPDAIALAIVSQVSAVASGRGGGHLRDRPSPLHASPQPTPLKSAPRIGAVVLAAGASTRLGAPKQLIMHEGEPLVRRIAAAAVEAGANPVVVVLGANADTIAPALSGLASVTIVENRKWSEGLSSSLATGLDAVFADASCDAVIVTLADQPLVDAAALKRLIAAFGDKRRIVASAYDDTIGVPALFAREHVDDLMRLTGDAGAGAWLRSRAGEVTRIPLGIAAFDIDTPSDAAGLL